MKNILLTLLLLITATSVFGQTDLLPGGFKGVDAGSDSTFLKVNGSAVGKRPTDNLYKNGTLGLRTTDTTGVLNIYTPEPTVSDKAKIHLTGDGHILLKVDRDTGTVQGSDFYMTRILGQSDGTPGNRNNQVWMAGWNVSAGGGLVDPTKPSVSLRLEEQYRNNIAQPYSFEVHLPDIRFVGGSGVRPLTGFFSRDPANRKGNWQFSSDFIDFSDYSDNQKVLWGFNTNGIRPKGISFLDTAKLIFYSNNTTLLQQRNAANTAFIDIIKVNASNQVEFSPTGNALYTTANNFSFQNAMTFQPNNGQGVAIGSSGNAAGQLEVFSLFPLWMKNSTNTSGFSFVLNGALELRDMSSNDAIITIANNAPADALRIRQQGPVGIGADADSDTWLQVKKSLLGANTKLLGIENSTGKNVIYRFSATPEGAITANPGDIALSSISSAGGLWLKKTGTGNTGWFDLGSLVTESTSVGSFNNTGNSSGLSLTGTALSLHAATISTPGGVNVGLQTFGVGADTKVFNGTGSYQITVDGNTDNTPAGINFTQLGGADQLGFMYMNSADANNASFRLSLEEGGALTDQLNIGTLNDTRGMYSRNGLYEDVTAVTTSPYTVLYGDRNIYLDGTTITVNLQAIGTSTGETKVGRVLYFFNDNATNVTITPNGSETINDSASLTLLPNTGVTLLAVTGTKWVTRD